MPDSTSRPCSRSAWRTEASRWVIRTIGRRGPQQRRDQHHDGHDGQGGGCRAQPLRDVGSGEQLPERAVHGQQAHRLGRAPAHLGGQHDPCRPRVRLPGQPQAGRQHAGQPDHHRPEAQLQKGVRMLVPPHVVPQRPPEQRPLRPRDLGPARLALLSHRAPPPRPMTERPLSRAGRRWGRARAGVPGARWGCGGGGVAGVGRRAGTWGCCPGQVRRAHGCGVRRARRRRSRVPQLGPPHRPKPAQPHAETARDQSGVVPVTRHRARYRGIGGV